MRAIKKLSEVHVLLAGEGKLRNNLVKFSEELNTKSRIYFLGYRSDIVHLIKAADILFSLHIGEKFGLAVIEVMACSISIIGTDVLWLNEIVIDGVSDKLIIAKDENVLVSSISLLLDNKNLCIKFKKVD